MTASAPYTPNYFACVKVGHRVSPYQCSRRCEVELWEDTCRGCREWVERLKPGQIQSCEKCGALVFAPFPTKCRACGEGSIVEGREEVA